MNPTFGQRLASLFRLLVMTAMFTTIGAIGINLWHAYSEPAKLAISDMVPRVTSMILPGRDQGSAMALPSAEATGSVQGNQAGVEGAALSGDAAQLLRSLARDVAAMGQDLAELKERMGRLSNGQDQIARDVARIRQPNSRPDVRSAMAAAPPPTPPAASDLRKPVAPPLSSRPR
ncbi:hypothetical protein [Bradyrhizobium sp.]|uniref:hypothetical protein n=1 Tax=Bradyrhizobium sp. TaxID=376 RepID=UPI001EBB48F4|nr:hypothetical protein [Bradyrhizobium sp.]MBV9982608.1 hypothetical protein [Bradyrhizobium sp.]